MDSPTPHFVDKLHVVRTPFIMMTLVFWVCVPRMDIGESLIPLCVAVGMVAAALMAIDKIVLLYKSLSDL